MAEKRLYTIPLRDAWNVSIKKRSKRAMAVIKAFAEKHMKSDSVKIGTELNHLVWVRGIKNPPRKVKVQMVPHKVDDKEVIWVDLATSTMDYLKTEKEVKKEKKEAVKDTPKDATAKVTPKTTDKKDAKKETVKAKPKAPAKKDDAKPKTAANDEPKVKTETKDTKKPATKPKPKASDKPKAEAKPKAVKK